MYSHEHSSGNQVACILLPMCAMTSDVQYNTKKLIQSLYFVIRKIEIIIPINNWANLLEQYIQM